MAANSRRLLWLEELINALQVATLLATRLRQQLGTQSQDAVQLEGALDRAVKTVQRQMPRKRRK